MRIVWLIYPRERMVEVYTPDGEVEILFEGDELTGGSVLPEFTMPVSEVFDDPLAELKIGQDSQDSVNSVGESF